MAMKFSWIRLKALTRADYLDTFIYGGALALMEDTGMYLVLAQLASLMGFLASPTPPNDKYIT